MKIFIVMVLYNPDEEKVTEFSHYAIVHNYYVVFVDNSTRDYEEKVLENEYVIRILLGRNTGIAFAQNAGIRYAISQNADTITLLDQDSEINEYTLRKLVQPVVEGLTQVSSPVIISKQTGVEYPSYIVDKNGKSLDVFSFGKSELVPVNLVVASGITCNPSVFKSIGLFDEDFFIDFVDIEWCMRAKLKGVKVNVVPEAVLLHQIGQGSKRIFGREVIIHSPERVYYKVRNSFLLIRKNVGFRFAIRQISPALVQNFFAGFSKKGKKAFYQYYFRGIIDGLLNKKGKVLI